jgi:hypothetical protein
MNDKIILQIEYYTVGIFNSLEEIDKYMKDEWGYNFQDWSEENKSDNRNDFNIEMEITLIYTKEINVKL